MAPPFEILAVDADAASLAKLLDVLRHLGYRSTGAPDFAGGFAMLAAYRYDLLITDLRLQEESGLELIRRARELQPTLAVVALAGTADAAVEADLVLLDATLIRKPVDFEHLSAVLSTKVPDDRKQRRWTRKRVAGGFGAKVGDTAAKVVDISYGGFRIEMSAPPESSRTIDMNLLPFGFVVNAQLVWVNRREPTGPWNCGAVLSQMDPTIERAWRVVVDALPDSALR